MSIIKKVITGFIVIILVPIIVAFFLTSDLSSTADKFFDSVKHGNYTKAYSLLSIDFTADVSISRLKKYLEENSLNMVKKTKYSSRSIHGNRAKIVGTAYTDNGINIPLVITFTKDTEWKINSIRRLQSGVNEKEQIPPEDELKELVSKTMHIFAISIKENNMEKLYRYVANVWRRTTTLEEFENTFGTFYYAKDALLVVDRVEPKFTTKAKITKDDILVVKGFYPTRPKKLYFEHKYIYEGIEWKLIALSVTIKGTSKNR